MGAGCSSSGGHSIAVGLPTTRHPAQLHPPQPTCKVSQPAHEDSSSTTTTACATQPSNDSSSSNSSRVVHGVLPVVLPLAALLQAAASPEQRKCSVEQLLGRIHQDGSALGRSPGAAGSTADAVTTQAPPIPHTAKPGLCTPQHGSKQWLVLAASSSTAADLANCLSCHLEPKRTRTLHLCDLTETSSPDKCRPASSTTTDLSSSPTGSSCSARGGDQGESKTSSEQLLLALCQAAEAVQVVVYTCAAAARGDGVIDATGSTACHDRAADRKPGAGGLGAERAAIASPSDSGTCAAFDTRGCSTAAGIRWSFEPAKTMLATGSAFDLSPAAPFFRAAAASGAPSGQREKAARQGAPLAAAVLQQAPLATAALQGAPLTTAAQLGLQEAPLDAGTLMEAVQGSEQVLLCLDACGELLTSRELGQVVLQAVSVHGPRSMHLLLAAPCMDSSTLRTAWGHLQQRQHQLQQLQQLQNQGMPDAAAGRRRLRTPAAGSHAIDLRSARSAASLASNTRASLFGPHAPAPPAHSLSEPHLGAIAARSGPCSLALTSSTRPAVDLGPQWLAQQLRAGALVAHCKDSAEGLAGRGPAGAGQRSGARVPHCHYGVPGLAVKGALLLGSFKSASRCEDSAEGFALRSNAQAAVAATSPVDSLDSPTPVAAAVHPAPNGVGGGFSVGGFDGSGDSGAMSGKALCSAKVCAVHRAAQGPQPPSALRVCQRAAATSGSALCLNESPDSIGSGAETLLKGSAAALMMRSPCQWILEAAKRQVEEALVVPFDVCSGANNAWATVAGLGAAMTGFGHVGSGSDVPPGVAADRSSNANAAVAATGGQHSADRKAAQAHAGTAVEHPEGPGLSSSSATSISNPASPVPPRTPGNRAMTPFKAASSPQDNVRGAAPSRSASRLLLPPLALSRTTPSRTTPTRITPSHTTPSRTTPCVSRALPLSQGASPCGGCKADRPHTPEKLLQLPRLPSARPDQAATPKGNGSRPSSRPNSASIRDLNPGAGAAAQPASQPLLGACVSLRTDAATGAAHAPAPVTYRSFDSKAESACMASSGLPASNPMLLLPHQPAGQPPMANRSPRHSPRSVHCGPRLSGVFAPDPAAEAAATAATVATAATAAVGAGVAMPAETEGSLAGLVQTTLKTGELPLAVTTGTVPDMLWTGSRDGGAAAAAAVSCLPVPAFSCLAGELGCAPEPAFAPVPACIMDTERVQVLQHQAAELELLAQLLLLGGQPVAAERAYARTVRVHVACLGEAHPRSIGALTAAADCCACLGRLEDAALMRKRAWQLHAARHGPLHPLPLEGMVALARCLGMKGDHAAACDLLQRASPALDAVLGAHSPSATACLMQLAAELQHLPGSQQRRVEVLRQVHKRCAEGPLGASSKEGLASLHALAACLQGQGRGEEAEECWQEELSLLAGAGQPDTMPQAMAALQSLAGCLYGKGQLDSALPLYERLAAAKAAAYGAQHPDSRDARQLVQAVRSQLQRKG